MACKITISLLTERQDGKIGDDWRYNIEAKVFNDGLKDRGVIKVAKHNLPSGQTQEPPSPETLVLDAGSCGSEALVRLQVDATEVDWLVHDKGSASLDTHIKCPGEGQVGVVRDVEITVGVTESPKISGDSSVFKVTLRLLAHCD